MEGEGETGSEEPEQEQCPTPELDSSAAVFTMEGFYKSGSIKVRIPDGYQYTNFKYTVDGTEPSESNGALPSKAGNITASKIKAGVQDENGTVTIKVVAFADGKTTSEVATLQLTLAPADMVSFNDLKLKQAILTSLGRADEDAGKAVIRQTEMTEIKELDCSNQGITDLTGLENAVNLEKLNASGNDLSMTFDNYAGKLSADSYAALKEIDLSGCGIKMQAKNSNFLSRLFGAANLESVNLSSNKMYGCFTLNAQAALDKLSVLNLSGNDLYGIQITGNGTFDALDKIDMKQNRVYPDENGGDWYSSAIDFGIGRFDFSDQKNLTDLMDYRIYDGGYTTVDFDNEADVLDLGTLLDREVSLTLTGYGAYQTMSGNVEGRDLPVMIASPDNNRLCQFTLSLEPGENEFTIPLAHVNGEKRTITVRVKVQDVPSDEGEESAGIKDPVLQKNIIKELNARSEYKENPLDPSSHVITKEEIAKLTSLYIQGSGAGVLVRDMSGMENAVNLTNLVMSNIGEAEVDASKWTNMTDLRLGYNEGSIKKVKGLASMKNLTNLSISGEYEELEGLNEIAGGLTSITVSSKNLKTAPNLSAAVNLTSALISAAADGTLPDLSANKKLSTYSITDIRDGFSYQSDSVYESLSTVSVSAKNGQSFTLPEFKSEKSITYQLTGRGGSPLKVDISGIKNAATMVYNNTAGDTDLTLTGKSETLTSFKAENGAKVISFDRDFSAPGMTTMKIGSGNYATTDVVIESQDSFPALEDLKLWMVIHMNKIPAGVSGMSSLKNLELRWCYDLASIDDFDFSKMTSLETLTIASASGLKGTLNGSTIPSALKNLAISYTGLSAVSDNWTEMPNLKSLNLSLNKFGDFPTAAVKAAPNAESMDLSGNLYSTIPEDAFDNNIALKTLTLGNYLPGVAGGNMSFNGMPLSELLEGTTAAKAVSSLKERLPEVNVTIYGGPDLFSPSGSYSCLKSIGTSEGDVSADFINDRDLVLRVPAGTGSITLKPLAILEDTSITVNGKEYASGDEVTIDLPGMETEISIVCDNPYQKEFASSGSGFGEAAESKVEYTLKVIAASY
ncbi:MAG: hypothetical protein IJ121_08080, partial [Eubacterium sp.]|nr:hypothetical protein [Eubacterium sp.]